MNSVPKLFSCYYADCWTENHFSTEFGVLTLNHTHSHTLFWGCVSRWFGRALAWHARGQRFDPAILHQKSTVLRRKYGAFLFAEADFWGLHCFACMSFGLFAENRDVPADKRVPITEETAVQQAAVRRSLLLFSVPRDGHSALCFLYEPCSRPSAGGSQNDTTQNIRRVMDTEVHP